MGKPFIIPVFLPHTACPHRCAFCNQSVITRFQSKAPSPEKIDRIITEYLSYGEKKRDRTQIAFFGGNFLGIPEDRIRPMLELAQQYVNAGKVDGIRLSTRPDTINPQTLSLLKEFSVDAVELGVQSMDDAVLEMSQRGHSSRDTFQAVRLLKDQPYEIILQMMVGLPGDNATKTLQTAE